MATTELISNNRTTRESEGDGNLGGGGGGRRRRRKKKKKKKKKRRRRKRRRKGRVRVSDSNVISHYQTIEGNDISHHHLSVVLSQSPSPVIPSPINTTTIIPSAFTH